MGIDPKNPAERLKTEAKMMVFTVVNAVLDNKLSAKDIEQFIEGEISLNVDDIYVVNLDGAIDKAMNPPLGSGHKALTVDEVKEIMIKAYQEAVPETEKWLLDRVRTKMRGFGVKAVAYDPDKKNRVVFLPRDGIDADAFSRNIKPHAQELGEFALKHREALTGLAKIAKFVEGLGTVIGVAIIGNVVLGTEKAKADVRKFYDAGLISQSAYRKATKSTEFYGSSAFENIVAEEFMTEKQLDQHFLELGLIGYGYGLLGLKATERREKLEARLQQDIDAAMQEGVTNLVKKLTDQQEELLEMKASIKGGRTPASLDSSDSDVRRFDIGYRSSSRQGYAKAKLPLGNGQYFELDVDAIAKPAIQEMDRYVLDIIDQDLDAVNAMLKDLKKSPYYKKERVMVSYDPDDKNVGDILSPAILSATEVQQTKRQGVEI